MGVPAAEPGAPVFGAPERTLDSADRTNMTPYGEIQLNLDKRLALSAIDTPQPPAGS